MTRCAAIVHICLAPIAAVNLIGCCGLPMSDSGRWHNKYAYVDTISPITFHYDHGVLAASYPGKRETRQVRFADVCACLGHVCLCGAGGYKIAELAVDTIRPNRKPLERGDFILISSKDHTVSDNGRYIIFEATLADGTNGAFLITFGCAGDLDGDDDTDQADLGILLAAWQTTDAGDLDGDGDTDQADLGILLADWGCGAP